jgi:hypothetical protein
MVDVAPPPLRVLHITIEAGRGDLRATALTRLVADLYAPRTTKTHSRSSPVFVKPGLGRDVR